jgi:hypothetical protein
MQLTTVGLDLAKHVFQAHGIDATGGLGHACDAQPYDLMSVNPEKRLP